MTNKLLAYGVAALVGFIIALALFGSHVKERERAFDRIVVRSRVDTVRQIVRVPLAAIHVAGRSTRSAFMKNKCCTRPGSGFGKPDSGEVLMKNKCCTQLDTILQLDSTALGSDSLQISYCLPEDRFEVLLRLSPRAARIAIPIELHDTLVEHTEAIATDRTRPWYEEALMVFGAAAAGYLLGRITP